MGPAALPIGVFDSGVGGLTVLRALAERLPHESFLYLGDTARLPYGTKTGDTVVRYSVQCAGRLVERGIKALVVACNTASSVALPALAQRYPGLPVLGVVEPGAEAACLASSQGRIAVIATEGTVRGGAYRNALLARRPEAEVTQLACPLFVALAEEGWVDGEVVDAVAHRYLDAAFGAATAPDTLLLGCTHFPVLAPALQRVVGPGVTLVDSAATTAAATVRLLAKHGLALDAPATADRFRFLATDGLARFARVGTTFLGRELVPGDVELVDL